MPKINRKYLSEKPIKYKSRSREHTSEFYNSIAWIRLRNAYFSTHPICECCLQHGIVTSAVDIHHKRPFMSGKTEEEKWNLFLNEKNLQSLCESCHYKIHNKIKRYSLKYCDGLSEKEYLDE